MHTCCTNKKIYILLLSCKRENWFEVVMRRTINRVPWNIRTNGAHIEHSITANINKLRDVCLQSKPISRPIWLAPICKGYLDNREEFGKSFYLLLVFSDNLSKNNKGASEIIRTNTHTRINIYIYVYIWNCHDWLIPFFASRASLWKHANYAHDNVWSNLNSADKRLWALTFSLLFLSQRVSYIYIALYASHHIPFKSIVAFTPFDKSCGFKII